VFEFQKTHVIRNLGSSQSFRFVKSMNVLEKRRKDRVPFFVKAKALRATKLSSSNKTNARLQEIEEHERKPDTSEKQSDFAGIFTDRSPLMSAGAGL